jgi:pimeloyl-ACP methyl ester carboxylesterase
MEDARRHWADIGDITCPTLVVRGAESDVFHDEDAAKLAQSLPNGRWVKVDKAGHSVQGDNPAGLVAALREFFADTGIERSEAQPTKAR